MVSRLIRAISTPVRQFAKPIGGLHEAAYLLAGLTLAAQVLALVRDRVFAHTFGAGEILDLYYAAFRIPDLVFALVASLVSAYVLIPRIAGKDVASSRRLISEAASFLVIAGGAVCAVLFAFMPGILFTLFPGFESSPRADEFVMLSRLLLIQPILLGLSGILGGVTQVRRRFALFALSPVLYNLGIIAGALFFYPAWGLLGIGAGVVLGAVLHLVINIPIVSSSGLFPGPVIPHPRAIWDVVKDSLPRSFALLTGSVTTLALLALAAGTGTGAIAVFTLASNLEAVPLALIGASYATAAFPVLAEEANQGRRAEFVATISTALRHVIFWSAAACVLTIVLRAHLVRIILGTGAFDWDATRLTAAVLALLVVALVAQGAVLLVSRALYAAGRSWLPFSIQLVGIVASVGSAWGLLALAGHVPLVGYFMEAMLRVSDVPGTSILFIAAGAALGQLFMGALSLAAVSQVAPGVARGILRPVAEGTSAAILGGAAAYGVLAFVGHLAPLTTLLAVATQAAIAGMVGLTVSALTLILLENREFRDLYEALRRLTSSRALQPSGAVLSDPSS